MSGWIVAGSGNRALDTSALISEAHVLFVEFNEVLVLDVHNEHFNADFSRSFLDVVRGPPFVLLVGQAMDFYLPCVILDVWVDCCWFGQS